MGYKEFIENILNTRGRFACGDEYHERHHIVPRCMGGTDDEENLIDLFAREHFEAHRLLALENPNIEKLVYAWWAMCSLSGSSKKRDKVTPEDYEEARKAFALLCSTKYSGEGNPMYGVHRYGEESPTYKKVWTEEERKHASEAQLKSYREHPERWKRPDGFMSGKNNAMYEKKHTDETKNKISVNAKERALKRKEDKQIQWISDKHCCEVCGKQMHEKYGSGRFCSKECLNVWRSTNEETKKKMSESKKGKVGHTWSEEQRSKIVQKLTGRSVSEETRKKISESKRGKPSPTKGIPRSEEIKRKMSEGRKGKYTGENSSFYGKHHSEETKRKLSEAHNKTVRCIDTGIVYCSATEASKQTGVDRSDISKCCNDKKKAAGGYHWEFVVKKEGN